MKFIEYYNEIENVFKRFRACLHYEKNNYVNPTTVPRYGKAIKMKCAPCKPTTPLKSKKKTNKNTKQKRRLTILLSQRFKKCC